MCWCERRYSPFLFVQVAPADWWSSELAEGHLILANFAHFRGLRAHLNLLFVIVGLLVAVWAFIGFLSFNIPVLLYVFVIQSLNLVARGATPLFSVLGSIESPDSYTKAATIVNVVVALIYDHLVTISCSLLFELVSLYLCVSLVGVDWWNLLLCLSTLLILSLFFFNYS